MKDRIRLLMENQQLTQQRFAEMLNISPASLSSIFGERTKPTLNHVDAIRKSFPNINLNWLLYGTGDMFVGSDETNQPAATSNYTPTGMDLELDFGDQPSTPLQGQMQQSTRTVPPVQSYKPEIQQVKIIDKPKRQISEIRIFYDDQTWETFVPKK